MAVDLIDDDESADEDEFSAVPALNCRDGFRVSTLTAEQDEFLEVRLEMTRNDEVMYSCRVWRSETRTIKDWGEQSRMLCVWQAIARYLNSSGSLETLFHGLSIPQTDPDFPITALSDGVVLFETVQECPKAEHMFVDLTTGRTILFVEDLEIRETTIDEVYERLRQVSEDDLLLSPAEEASLLCAAE